jgi:hypothetical protein
MKSALILLSLLTLASCGKKTYTKNVENPFDNSGNEARLAELEARIAAVELSHSSLVNEMESTGVDLQGQIDATLVTIATLQGAIDAKSSVEYIDPCGDGAGFDEVILRVTTGGEVKLIAYFEQGSQRFLSELPDGNYRTTDQQSCNFSVSSGEVEF